MRVIVCKDYDEVSNKAAELVEAQIILKPNSVLGLATGSTPIGMYEKLAKKNIDFSAVKTFNLDEYYPISPTNPQSYKYFMEKNFFGKINIKEENVNIPSGEAKDISLECTEYDTKIKNSGGIDLQILGIGQNGHIGFNEPDANLCAGTHLTDLTQSTIAANSRFFDNENEVPKQAITMGISTILSAKKIILLACGASKNKVVSELLKNKINTDVPATMLNVHSDVILICDEKAYQSAKLGIDIGGTEIKFVALDKGQIIYKESIKTNRDSAEAIINDIVCEYHNISKSISVQSVGIGVPGSVYRGYVTTDNLPFDNFPFLKTLQSRVDLPIQIENDANCAVCGERYIGKGKEYENIVMVTIGTGIGGGVIINNKLCSGNGEFGEIGHMVIQANGGEKCVCGQTGCFERYASANALVRQAVEAAEKNPQSKIYEFLKQNDFKLNGKQFFEILDSGCGICKKVFKEYIDWLLVGLKNIEKIYDPDIIILAGGITKQGKRLLDAIDREHMLRVPVRISELAGDAGAVGAAYL